MEFTIGASDGENTSNSKVRGISFNGEWSIGDPMSTSGKTFCYVA